MGLHLRRQCTRVCPKHVDPAGAIQRYKLEAAKESVMAFLLPGVRYECPDHLPAAGVETVVDEEEVHLHLHDA